MQGVDQSASWDRHDMLRERFEQIALYRWWRRSVVGRVDHEAVMARITEDSGWSPRYAFMVMMSAGIAVLGLLLSSPAVVIGAMLISPLMSPILGLGFSLVLFDFAEMRRSLTALAVGAVTAVVFTALIVAISPLQAPTSEIIARTRPNLFDLAVALFAALAGTFAIIRGRGDTIVGVAIATALMPPLAVVGYGLATWNMPVLGGAFALFVTNFVTIALSATVMARFYGFGHHLSSQQSWTQTFVLLFVFVAMAIPLGISLKQIAGEAVTLNQTRSFLSERFGADARVAQLDMDFDADPVVVRAVVITPRDRMQRTAALQSDLTAKLGRPLRLRLDQVLLEAGAGPIEAQREEMRQAGDAAAIETQRITGLSQMLALTAGIAPDSVTVDRDHHRAMAIAEPLPGASLATYRTLERRAAAQADGWDVVLTPPRIAYPPIGFTGTDDTLDAPAREGVLVTAWAARRWNVRRLGVPGLPADIPEHPSLIQRRAIAIAALLRENGIEPVTATAAGSRFALRNVEEADDEP
ncbi:putative hydrophobic protein (TIGR00271 family) [Novosphingobium sp. ST904]|nr:putative hydrophobic protein (TIGR00271 family) [Novosphingobium sp. ST904]